MQQEFIALTDHVQTKLKSDEAFTLSFAAEDSDFVRFNQNRVRQPGSVVQRYLGLRLIRGQRHVSSELTLVGDPTADRARLDEVVLRLRDRLEVVPEDPHLLLQTAPLETERIGKNELPDPADVVDKLLGAGGSRRPDLVGVYAGGGIYRGFSSSYGQRSWFSTHSFQLDWSLVESTDKAVKTGYGGFSWSDAAFEARYANALSRLDILARPARTITPGAYRAFLTPAAVQEIVGMMTWGGFGLRAVETKQTSLLRLIQGTATLSPLVSISENAADGVAPAFQDDGFLKPDRVQMIDRGRWHTPLISPRSAREYGQPTNGSGPEETPQSIDMAAGDLAEVDILKRLDTGLYISNLWYLNFSDRTNGRITGMTRFATLWVENGEIVAPVNVMRFDETLFRVLGDNLEALTAERDFILSSDTYFRRSTDSARLPGALVRDFTFTL